MISGMKVGEIAKRTGLSVRTLHYYDEIGLLRPSTLTTSRHRVYDAAQLARLQQIKSLRQLEFSLDEIRDCLEAPELSPRRVLELHVQRIRAHIEEQGGRVIRIDWSPFGRGWFGSKNERIYEVEYEDSNGYAHKAYCKTSMWSGVYWTEDKIVHPLLDRRPQLRDLAAENRALREELERLKGKES